jgi:hypothetical protein
VKHPSATASPIVTDGTAVGGQLPPVVIVSVTFASTCEWPEEVVGSTELKNASARASTNAPRL